MTPHIGCEKALLKQWQLIAVEFLSDKNASPSELKAAYIALRRDAPKLAEMCLKAAKARAAQWRVTSQADEI
jgi:hypothetical protein